MATGHSAEIARLEGVTNIYRKASALDGVSLSVPAGILVGFIGPDGVGKSSLLSILAGARQIQSGEVHVLGGDMRDASHRARACPRIAYMPQGLGKNLYPDLSVQENIAFFSRLFGQSRQERRYRTAELLAATGLAPFADRAANKLSGGMKQKLGLCCALIHDPDLLILDEPTTGVDPLSRRQFWELIDRIRTRRPGISVIVATAYMEEAQRFDWLVAMNAGRVVATGSPAELMARSGANSIEDAFVALLPPDQRAGPSLLQIPPRAFDGEPVIVARELTRRFGDFTAVDEVSFTIKRGEIFGFLGSNGCGKTTTIKMLTGLLTASGGEAQLFGRPVDSRDLNARRRVGYMSQSFSLYIELTIRQNLALHARLFHLPPDKAKARIEELVRRFDLAAHLDQLAGDLPLGIRQRLSLAVAVVHEPEILVLDEPTSGVDPGARDRFWRLLIDLSRNDGVTIFISTHFMNEAARCDRISLMDTGRVLATDTPAGLVASSGARTLEDAFIGHLEAAARARTGGRRIIDTGYTTARSTADAPMQPIPFSPRRLAAFTIRETLELLRDPIRLGFALFGTAFLMLVFGFGISTDVDNLSFSVLDRDQSHASRAYLEELRGSRYFSVKTPLIDYADLEKRTQAGAISAGIEIPPGFGRDIAHGRPTWVAAWIDGAMPFRAQTIRGYLEGMHQLYLDRAAQAGSASRSAASVEIRFRYNQNFNSIYAMVPATIALLLALFPAILMALAIVREKELGSITNLYVTPGTRLEFLIGKQLPYIAVAILNFALMFAMALLVFGVPLKGSFATLLLGALAYVMATTGYGMLISAFARTQIAALFGTAILTVLPAISFSGMLVPVSALSGTGQFMGRGFPMTYFLPISVGTFTKGLGFADLAPNLAGLAVFIPVLLLLSLGLLRAQER